MREGQKLNADGIDSGQDRTWTKKSTILPPVVGVLPRTAGMHLLFIIPPTYDVINNSRTFECRPHLPYFYSLILRSRPLRMAQHNYDPILDDDIIG